MEVYSLEGKREIKQIQTEAKVQLLRNVNSGNVHRGASLRR